MKAREGDREVEMETEVDRRNGRVLRRLVDCFEGMYVGVSGYGKGDS
jgi:hypothetical protein